MGSAYKNERYHSTVNSSQLTDNENNNQYSSDNYWYNYIRKLRFLSVYASDTVKMLLEMLRFCIVRPFFRVSIRECVLVSMISYKQLGEFHELYSFGALRNKDDMV